MDSGEFRREQVMKSIAGNEFIVVGPVNLLQGGTAIIARLPIFVDGVVSRTGFEDFWGFATVLVDVDSVVPREIQDRFTNSDDRFRMVLRGRHGLGEAGEVILGDPEDWEHVERKMEVTLPNGSWIMGGYGIDYAWIASLKYIAGLIVGLLAGALFWKLLSSNVRLISAINANATLEAEILAQEKGLALSMISSGVAHEFNNLLMAISSTVDVMRMDENASQDIAEDIDLVKEETRCGQRLTKQLLTYSRELDLKPQATSCASMSRR